MGAMFWAWLGDLRTRQRGNRKVLSPGHIFQPTETNFTSTVAKFVLFGTMEANRQTVLALWASKRQRCQQTAEFTAIIIETLILNRLSFEKKSLKLKEKENSSGVPQSSTFTHDVFVWPQDLRSARKWQQFQVWTRGCFPPSVFNLRDHRGNGFVCVGQTEKQLCLLTHAAWAALQCTVGD